MTRVLSIPAPLLRLVRRHSHMSASPPVAALLLSPRPRRSFASRPSQQPAVNPLERLTCEAESSAAPPSSSTPLLLLSLSSPSSSSSSPPSPPPVQNRFHATTPRFESFAQQRNMSSALQHLEQQGAQLHKQRLLTALDYHHTVIAQRRREDDVWRERGKTPPPRAALVPPDFTKPADAMDYLSCHAPSVLWELMRTFSSHGDVDGCYVLLTRLYQLALHHKGLVACSSNKGKDSKATHKPGEPEPAKEVKEATVDEKRSRYTPDSSLLGMIMTAYTVSSIALPSNHALQLVSHHTTLQLEPSAEFYRSLFVFHAHHHTVHTCLSTLTLLTRSQNAPTADLYVRAIRYFGLHCHDHDSAVLVFLHLTSIALPNAAAYNTLIAVLGERGDWMMAHRLMGDMERQGQMPSAWTYAGVLKALLVDGKEAVAQELYEWVRQVKRKEAVERWQDNCYMVMLQHAHHRGDFERVIKVWQEMEKDQVEPERRSYHVILTELTRIGRLHEAAGVVRQMLDQPVHSSQGLDAIVSYHVALKVTASRRDAQLANEVYQSWKQWSRAQGVRMPSTAYRTMMQAYTPVKKQGEAALPAATRVQLCLQLLSLARDRQEKEGMNHMVASQLRSVLREYGAVRCATRLLREVEKEEAGMRYSEAELKQAEEDVVSELGVNKAAPRMTRRSRGGRQLQHAAE